MKHIRTYISIDKHPITGLLFVLLLYGNHLNATKQATDPYLLVKPKICITKTNKQPCDAEFYAEWLYLEPISACLYSDQSSKPISCWDEKQTGHADFKMRSNNNVMLYLRQNESQNHLLSAKIEIMSKGIRVKSLRRKKRHAWSIF